MSRFLILAPLVLLQVLGNTLLSRGIRQLGAVTGFNPWEFLALVGGVLTDPWTVGGISLLMASFGFYLAAISRYDLSYVLPITASSYAMTTLSAWLILGERVALGRWLGTLLVTTGVLLVGLSGHRQGVIQAGPINYRPKGRP